MTTELDPFETRLLTALRDEVTERDLIPAARPSRLRRRILTAGAVAAAAGGLLFVPGIGTTPAYSVQEGNAGEVIVEINKPEDAEGLQRALAEHGITADITYLPELQTCAPGRYTEVGRTASGLTVSVGSESIGVTIPPGTVRSGETFVLAWSVMHMTEEELAAVNEDNEPGTTAVEGFHGSVDFAVASGPVGACTPVTATP